MLRSRAKGPPEPLRGSPGFLAQIIGSDHYVAVFCLIIAALILTGAGGDLVPIRILVAALLGANILFTLYVSDVSRRWIVLALVIVGLALLLAGVAEITEALRLATVAEAGLGALLVLITPIIIGRHLIHHVAVTLQTVAGALSIYLLLGIFFAYVYRVLDALTSAPVFAQNAHPRVVDFVYFSFVTITTLGYGDLTPAFGLARMLAVTEALFGQFYLVTVMALLVTRLTLPRDRRGDAP